MAVIMIEGMAACLIALLACAAGIADGAHNMVFLYEKEVQERAVSLGLISAEKIRKNGNRFKLLGILTYFIFVLFCVYAVNGARGFRDGFIQLLTIFMIYGLFDRLFIDWYWVGKTKAWVIPGTEDLMPYIYGRTLAAKWLSTLVGMPVLAALIAGAVSFILK